jgi:hypothetical protein
MSSTNDRQAILDMLASGKISAVEAAGLLRASADRPATPEPATIPVEEIAPDPVALKKAEARAEEAPGAARGGGPSWFHVKVTNMQTGKTKVTVNIPIRLLRFGVKIGSQFAPELQGMSWSDIGAMLESSGDGILVDVQDEEDGERVQIYVD